MATMTESNWHPEQYGSCLPSTSGEAPNVAIALASTLLERQPIYVDAEGFKCEVFAAAIHSDGKRLIYLESRFKEISQYVDITFKIHHVNSNDERFSVDIESYNPYSGCHVGLIEWINDDVALLV